MSVIYGQLGSCKTYSSGTLDDKTLIIEFDRGTSAIPQNSNVDVFAPASYEELISSMYEIENSEYDNVVLDILTSTRVISRMSYKDGEHKIALEQHNKCITEASVYGLDISDIKSFKELIQILEKDK